MKNSENNIPGRRQQFVQTLLEFLWTLTVEIPLGVLEAAPLHRALYNKGLSEKNIKQGVYNLRYRGFIEEGDGEYVLTSQGKKWFVSSFTSSRYKFFKLSNKKWDRKWRIIMFDIPSDIQKKRHSFRTKLRSIGAFMIQKSVFVFPYPCQEEISCWCRHLEIDNCVEIITTDHIGSKEPYAKKLFGLK